jgi:hypothetical protein
MKSNQYHGTFGSVNEFGVEKRAKDVTFVNPTLAGAGARDLPSTGWLKDEAKRYHDLFGEWPNELHLYGQSKGTKYTGFMVGNDMVSLKVIYGAESDELTRAQGEAASV